MPTAQPAIQSKALKAGGKKVRSHPRGGQSGPLTGQNLFTAINRNQALLGLLPPLDGGESDISELYFKKLGNPPPGSRVFICVRQQVNGWRDHPRRIEAVSRPTPALAAPANRRKATAEAP